MLVLALLACAGRVPPAPPTPPTEAACTLSSCLPEDWASLPLGTPLGDFQARFPDAVSDAGAFDFRLVFEVEIEGRPSRATLYFDADMKDQPLYEFIFEYGAGVDVAAEARRLWGEPNAGEEWLLPVAGDVALKGWTFQDKIVIVAPWAGTEWGEGG